MKIDEIEEDQVDHQVRLLIKHIITKGKEAQLQKALDLWENELKERGKSISIGGGTEVSHADEEAVISFRQQQVLNRQKELYAEIIQPH